MPVDKMYSGVAGKVVIASLAIIMIGMCVPASSQWTRGPGSKYFNDFGCSDSNLTSSSQYYTDEELDDGIVGKCVNTSGVGYQSSQRFRCEGGAQVWEAYQSADCTGFGTIELYTAGVCLNYQSPYGNYSDLFLCSPTDSFTTPAWTLREPGLDEFPGSSGVPCYSPHNCTAGTMYATLYNNTDRPEPICDDPEQSLMIYGNSIPGQCYAGGDYYRETIHVSCDGTNALAHYSYSGCDGPVYSSYGSIVTPDVCFDSNGHGIFTCPGFSPPQAAVPSHASINLPQIALFAFVALFALIF